MIRIRLDGKEKIIEEGMTVMDLVRSLNLDPRRSLLQLNSTILEKALYSTTTLKDGDEINVIRIIGGG